MEAEPRLGLSVLRDQRGHQTRLQGTSPPSGGRLWGCPALSTRSKNILRSCGPKRATRPRPQSAGATGPAPSPQGRSCLRASARLLLYRKGSPTGGPLLSPSGSLCTPQR